MIKFSGKHIVAHANEGGSEFLLVTFNQLDSPHIASDRYFMQPQVEAKNISCVGVMTPERGFYLSPEMDAVVALVDGMRAGRPVVVFGQSMGGYAALKFSRRLGADFVIASSPFYSVDDGDLELPDEQHRRILLRSLSSHGVVARPEFVGMKIRPEDVSGRLVVLYDPAEMIDTFAARLIEKYMPQTEFITIPHAGHVIYDASWSADLASELLQAIQSPDKSSMLRTVCALRRTRSAFMVRTLSKAANRKPRLCVQAMRAPRIARHADYRDLIGDPLNLRAIYLLAERGDSASANAHLAVVMRDFYGIQIRPHSWSASESAAEILSRSRCLVLSCHGSFLTWSTEHEAARFEPHPFKLTTRAPIVASLVDGVARFAAIIKGVEKPVRLFGGGDHEAIGPEEEIVPADGRLVALRGGGQYLGALPAGGPQLLPGISHQQRMIVLPLRDDSSLFEIAASGWLDSVMSEAAMAPAGRPPVMQRATPRWRRMFMRS